MASFSSSSSSCTCSTCGQLLPRRSRHTVKVNRRLTNKEKKQRETIKKLKKQLKKLEIELEEYRTSNSTPPSPRMGRSFSKGYLPAYKHWYYKYWPEWTYDLLD